ncbi:MAG: alginate lyase family protein [Chloroflexota bacterium]
MSFSQTHGRHMWMLVAGFLLLTLMGSPNPTPAQAHVASGSDTPDLAVKTGGASAYLPVFARPEAPQSGNMWVSPEQLATLPTFGPAWENLFDAAQENTSSPDLSDQNDKTNVYVLAKALVYARTGNGAYREQVMEALRAVIGTEDGSRTLAAGRNLPAFVIAADLIDLSFTPGIDAEFRAWLHSLLSANLDGDTLRSTHESRANNWGTHAGAARAAIAIYLGDQNELARTAQVFRGFVGDRDSYAGFSFGDLWWQCDPLNPVPINPAGCTVQGHSVDGLMPDEQRRAGPFQWPPPRENYVWGGLQGAVVQAQLLHRAGYPAWEWEDSALLRTVTWLHEQANYPAEGDDEWQPWLINAVYDTEFPAEMPAGVGKNVAWTDWAAPALAP